ncbi:MAG: ATP-binding cassette domain-containing protein [Candidatus Sumerlaeaceae bacterium]|nr:ATP-binding cassette domain-containing protein [Candidatus Sumerlaeaceae bacterium]
MPISESSKPLIHVQDLTKVFRAQKLKEGMLGALKNLIRRETYDVVAVDKMSFDIAEGELIGYIGANGAGKSTTIKMLTGILLPTSGDVEVAGYIPFKQRRKYVRNIGVVFGQRTQLWWDLAVIESFKLLGRIYEVPDNDFKKRLTELTELLALEEFLNTPVRKLSLGQRMRADLTASLLHRPKILFLDEPTIGLDIIGKARVRDFLRQINEREKVTILLTTHDLDEIERLCERIVIIDHGRKVFDGELARLLELNVPTKKMLVDFVTDPAEGDYANLGPRGITFRRTDEYRGEFTYERARIETGELIQLITQLHAIRDLHIEEPGIEDVVKDIYAGSS